jgi:hypothetical protein
MRTHPPRDGAPLTLRAMAKRLNLASFGPAGSKSPLFAIETMSLDRSQQKIFRGIRFALSSFVVVKKLMIRSGQ